MFPTSDFRRARSEGSVGGLKDWAPDGTLYLVDSYVIFFRIDRVLDLLGQVAQVRKGVHDGS